MSKQRLLNILIPTYNRDKELILNLSRIKRELSSIPRFFC